VAIIVQQIGAVLLPGQVQRIVVASADRFLIGVPWERLEPRRGHFDAGVCQGLIEATLSTNAVPILRLTWPVPPWAPRHWAARSALGQHSFNERAFLRLGRCPSIFCDEAWDAVYRAQAFLAGRYPGAEFSPPGGGGGEWTYPNNHLLPGVDETEITEVPWCFCPSALAKWERAYRRGLAGSPEPPRGFPECWQVPGFTAWYLGAIQDRLRQAIRRSPGACPWVALIPRGGYQKTHLCSGAPGLEEVAISEGAKVIVHCLFGPGNSDESRAFTLDLLHRFRECAVGVEGWQGLAAHAPILAKAGGTHLLVGAAGLADEGLDQLAFWGRWWKAKGS
jgi:hypothetical protein